MTAPALRNRPAATAHEAIKVLDVHLRVAGMSRDALARKIGVGERTVADWWLGKGDPHVALLEAALSVFNLRLKVAAK